MPSPDEPTTPPRRPHPHFDAVLIISFGGPNGMDDVRPFLANVLRGRHVPEERIEEVVHHYKIFDGVSPLTQITQDQAGRLRQQLIGHKLDLPVFVGMRNWHPLLTDTLAEMSRQGIRHAIGIIAAPHHSYSSCQQYKENLRDANAALIEQGMEPVQVTFVDSWYDHDEFITSWALQTERAIAKLDPMVRAHAQLVFTAHSIPQRMADTCRYQEQLTCTAELIAEDLGWDDWQLVYQSRSGRPQDPWLGPDVCDYLRTAKQQRVQAVVLVPIGFVCDHIEVLYDLDVEAAQVAKKIDLPLVRASALNTDTRFINMLADQVQSTAQRFALYPPLPLNR